MGDEITPLTHPDKFSFRQIDKMRRKQQEAEARVVSAAEKIVRRAYRKMKPPEKV